MTSFTYTHTHTHTHKHAKFVNSNKFSNYGNHMFKHILKVEMYYIALLPSHCPSSLRLPFLTKRTRSFKFLSSFKLQVAISPTHTSLSLSHTHTHTISLSLSLFLTPFFAMSFSTVEKSHKCALMAKSCERCVFPLLPPYLEQLSSIWE